MRDGSRQFADIYFPAKQRGPFPALLERTPYSKSNSSEIIIDAHNFYASQGYVVVIADVRGRFKSEGDFYPFRDDPTDGYDSVEWIAAQPWCNGRVGTMGGSYSGATQYRMAPTRPPHLACMFCRESSSDYAHEWVFRGGAFELGFMWPWTVKWILNSERARKKLTRKQIKILESALEDADEHQGRLRIAPEPLVQGHYDWYNEWLERCDDAQLWNSLSIARDHDEIDTPIFHLGGWFDIFQRGTFDHFLGIRVDARTMLARRSQRLLVGPWQHGPKLIGERLQGEVDFGESAALDFNQTRLPWYDFWLKGIDKGVMNDLPVRLFVMGANEWREFFTWPPPDVRYVNLHFHRGKSGSAQSLNDGRLNVSAPGPRSAPDRYKYDPMHPTPSIGGNTLNLPGGPRDQRDAEKEILTYTTEPLIEDVTIIGPVRSVLYASSSSRDTDWVVRLTDVHPPARRRDGPKGGVSMLVCDGILRARYRENRFQTHLLEKGHVYRFEVDLWSTAHVFRAGHRIRVSVSSSCFPRYDRNLNTGEKLYFGGRCEVARNTIYHDASHPSCIVLPVIG